jgi:hypothetical protein
MNSRAAMNSRDEVLRRIARESGRFLGELGVRPADEQWIREHAETIASLRFAGRPPRRENFFYRLARRAARTAR